MATWAGVSGASPSVGVDVGRVEAPSGAPAPPGRRRQEAAAGAAIPG